MTLDKAGESAERISLKYGQNGADEPSGYHGMTMKEVLYEIANRAANMGDDDAVEWMPSIYSIACKAIGEDPAPKLKALGFDGDVNNWPTRRSAAASKAKPGQALPAGGTGVPYGIIDPDYARIFTMARTLAWSEGYALLFHGSFTRDLDLIAVPWTAAACAPDKLVRRVADATDLNILAKSNADETKAGSPKEHGRLAWTLTFKAFADPRFVDFSVMPRVSPAHDAALSALRKWFGMQSGENVGALYNAASTLFGAKFDPTEYDAVE